MANRTKPYQVQLADYLRYAVGAILASWAHPTRGWPSFIVPGIALICLGLFQYAALLPVQGARLALIQSGLIVAATFLAGIALILLIICLRTYASWRAVSQDPRMALFRIIHINQDGIQLERGGEIDLWSWAETQAVKRVGNALGVQVVFNGQAGIHIIPLRAFTSQAEQQAFFDDIKTYQTNAPVVSIF